jgi:methyltransferase (TIGR00027 family)
MKKQQSSITAEGIAIVRAMESAKPATERLFDDPYAKYFVTPVLAFLTKFFTKIGYAEKRGPGVLGFLIARTKYIDDYLQSCIDDKIEQLVILGAGFDARAYRFDSLKRQVKVFEVDHPATQKVKLDRLKKILGALPEHVVYVPIDFDAESLEECLFKSGYDEQLKTLFIWEGVTYYITAEAVDRTLAFVANRSGAGSSIIFDYADAAVVNGTVKRGEASSMQRYQRLTGEGMVFGIEKGTIEAFLEERGFYRIKNVTHDLLKKAYFQNREVAPVYAIVSAVVLNL